MPEIEEVIEPTPQAAIRTFHAEVNAVKRLLKDLDACRLSILQECSKLPTPSNLQGTQRFSTEMQTRLRDLSRSFRSLITANASPGPGPPPGLAQLRITSMQELRALIIKAVVGFGEVKRAICCMFDTTGRTRLHDDDNESTSAGPDDESRAPLVAEMKAKVTLILEELGELLALFPCLEESSEPRRSKFEQFARLFRWCKEFYAAYLPRIMCVLLFLLVAGAVVVLIFVPRLH